jgi:hypothetical protein
MSELKTRLTDESVEEFLNSIPDEKKRLDSFALLDLMKQVTGFEAKMWGSSIIGFGSYHYRSTSGREGDWFLVGFSPRKQNLSIYIMPGFDQYNALMQKLGKHKTGKSCLYINRLEDIDLKVLRELVDLSVKHMIQTNP